MDFFLMPPQSVVSFSGGRTSGYMLWCILQAHGGSLPESVKVVFCNTGKEREETLDFVEECSQRWGVEINWLEYRYEPSEAAMMEATRIAVKAGSLEGFDASLRDNERGKHTFGRVDHATASRKGEPFEMVIQARGGILPNPVMRFCTAELKIRTTNRFVRQALGWETYTNAIGLRADEEKRVARMQQRRTTEATETLFGVEKKVVRAVDLPKGESPVFPLYDAGLTVDDVMGFWGRQPFDLRLNQDEGNCDLCFMKGAPKLLKIMEQKPEAADWWAAQGRTRNPSVEQFRKDRPSYLSLKLIAEGKQDEPGWLWADKDDGSCGEIDECRCTD